ncbi:MAG TPA: hypothetical protein VKG82_02325 [Solirubrobacteraceae bacterium]|nr:hypothetical protein [Solirubrobacteraceae bacterium]
MAQTYTAPGREDGAGTPGLYAGSAQAFVIGEDPRPWWDAIVVVEYPRPI